MNEAHITRKPQRFSPVWIVPLVAVMAGIWMVVHSVMTEGPEIHIRFATAEGLKAGETRVKRLSVDLGVVEDVYLNDGFGDVTAVVKLDDGTRDLLREDTQFWVVRPRIGAGGVSGLSTLLSGAYIELAPGAGTKGKRDYRGLEDLPVTPQSAAGSHLSLVADRAASLSVGSPVLYNGYKVGQVEEAGLNAGDGKAQYRVFVDSPYDDLVTTNTRFWNASGISVNAGAEGLAVRTESLEALLSGGVAFGLPNDVGPGQSLPDEHQFTLHPTFASIQEHPYQHNQEYLLLFDASVRGLHPGAPVEYRGIRLGTVLDVSFDLVSEEDAWTADGHALMPVLIRVDPGRFSADTTEGLEEIDQIITNGIDNGMRATLASGNLLTGALYVSFDFHENAGPAAIQDIGGRRVLPTVETGLTHIQSQVSAVLAKLEALPLEGTVDAATTALDNLGHAVTTADRTLSDVNRVLEDPKTIGLPASLDNALGELNVVLTGLAPESSVYNDLEAALAELRRTLHSVGELSSTLEAKPNALVFSAARGRDPIPEIKR